MPALEITDTTTATLINSQQEGIIRRDAIIRELRADIVRIDAERLAAIDLGLSRARAIAHERDDAVNKVRLVAKHWNVTQSWHTTSMAKATALQHLEALLGEVDQ